MILPTCVIGLLAIPLVYAAPQAQNQTPSSTTGVTVTAGGTATGLASSPSSTASPDPLTTEETASLFQLHEDLVNIPSISDDEIECAEWLEEYLGEKGYYVERVPVTAGAEGRFNVFAYPQTIRDNGSWPEVLISSHIDTVPPFIPFKTREENGTTYHFGRGSVDAKGPIATMIIATEKFLASRDDSPSLGLLFVVGEETGGDGMRAFAEYASNTTFRAGIFGEPTEGKLATGHKGTLGLTLDVVGRSAHSAYPQLGLSAINYLSKAIVAMNSLEPALPRSELLGPSTLNVGIVRGGLANNVIAPNATAGVSIRIARSENGSVEIVRDMIAGMIQPIIQEVEERNGTFNATFSTAFYPAQILDTSVPGLEEAPVFYGTDIPLLPQVGQRYLYGTGTIEVAHTPNEQLAQDELVQGAQAYGLILKHLFPES
ncbi:Acetylornithine deacetylase [Ascochyta rabiei]|uniref:Metallopeptidase n=1 Tax=Didymella rabiei TaxID=5454 RepID=A0A163BSW8_DIDRA|nr:Acetylornithine deacetylase [Ascochyta rabiei]KZM21958.1 metallopeptidase [Ascochyta rabiei]UPX14586.1 Acetylornithine deacetylase [Ascochyta rabiei]